MLNSLFFNLIKPLNAVYISRRLLSLLRIDEIKAIVAHELAHFYGYIRPLNRARFALMGFNALLPVHLALDQGAIPLRAALLLWIATSFFYMRLLNLWLGRASQDFEYLCDLAAARRCGILNLVNGLLRIVRVSEVQAKIANALVERIRHDDTLSIKSLESLLERCEARLPDRPLSASDIERAIRDVLSQPASKKLRRKLSRSAQAKEEKAIQALCERLLLKREFQLLDWSRFDVGVPDGRVSPAEYPALLEALRSSPDQQLFDLPTDNILFAANGSHPTVAQRILFLEQARQLDPSIPL